MMSGCDVCDAGFAMLNTYPPLGDKIKLLLRTFPVVPEAYERVPSVRPKGRIGFDNGIW